MVYLNFWWPKIISPACFGFFTQMNPRLITANHRMVPWSFTLCGSLPKLQPCGMRTASVWVQTSKFAQHLLFLCDILIRISGCEILERIHILIWSIQSEASECTARESPGQVYSQAPAVHWARRWPQCYRSQCLVRAARDGDKDAQAAECIVEEVRVSRNGTKVARLTPNESGMPCFSCVLFVSCPHPQKDVCLLFQPSFSRLGRSQLSSHRMRY